MLSEKALIEWNTSSNELFSPHLGKTVHESENHVTGSNQTVSTVSSLSADCSDQVTELLPRMLFPCLKS